MQRAADALVGTLREFINQPDYPTLVLGGTDSAIGLPNRTLYSFAQEDEDHYYLIFTDPCPSAPAYMDAIAKSLVTQREALNAELVAQQIEPLPPFPLEVEDSRVPPAKRLQRAVEWCGEHFIGPDDIVWGLMPGELGDIQGYKAMIAPLLALQQVEPWMERHRFVVRDRDPEPVIIPELFQAKNDRVLVMELDFSNEAVERDLHATALDQSLPHHDRVMAFFQLGAIDFAFKRFPQALEKYGACFNFWDAKGEHALAALCLKGAGDTMLYAGQPLEALKFFQRAVALSITAGNLTALQQSLFSCGTVSMDLGKTDEAEGYFQHSSNVSGKLCNPYTKCDALEKQGEAQWKLGKLSEARENWEAGKNLARQFGYTERALSILDRLTAMYRVSGMLGEARACETERAQISAGAPHVPA